MIRFLVIFVLKLIIVNFTFGEFCPLMSAKL